MVFPSLFFLLNKQNKEEDRNSNMPSTVVEQVQVPRTNENIFLFVPNLIGKESICFSGMWDFDLV